MVTFFGILLTLLAANVVLLVVSVNHKTQKEKPISKNTPLAATSDIHPLDLILPKYKKAV